MIPELKVKLILNISITTVLPYGGIWPGEVLHNGNRTIVTEEVSIEISPQCISSVILPDETKSGFTDYGYTFDFLFETNGDVSDIFKYGQRFGMIINEYFPDIRERKLCSYVQSINPEVSHRYFSYDECQQSIIKDRKSKIYKNKVLNVTFKHQSIQ